MWVMVVVCVWWWGLGMGSGTRSPSSLQRRCWGKRPRGHQDYFVQLPPSDVSEVMLCAGCRALLGETPAGQQVEQLWSVNTQAARPEW